MELNTLSILWLTVALVTGLHTVWTLVSAASDNLPPFLARDPSVSAPYVWGGVLLAAAAHALYLLIQL